MMKKLYILLSLSLISCETIIDPVLPEDDNNLVFYSFLRPDAPITLDVFQAIPIRDVETFERAGGLTISLTENGQVIETLTPEANGQYSSSILPSTGNTYGIITTSEGQTITATTSVPETVEILNASIEETVQDVNIGEFGYPASITISDPGDKLNFYSLEIIVENCEGNDCQANNLAGELNEVLIEELDVETSGTVNVTIGAGPEELEGFRFLYFDDNGFNGNEFTLNFFIIPTLVNFDREEDILIKFVLKTLKEEYYKYLVTSDFQQQQEEEGAFTEPVQVFSNVENALGTFAGYNYTIYVLSPQ